VLQVWLTARMLFHISSLLSGNFEFQLRKSLIQLKQMHKAGVTDLNVLETAQVRRVEHAGKFANFPR
jgi:hypothetical protein